MFPTRQWRPSDDGKNLEKAFDHHARIQQQRHGFMAEFQASTLDVQKSLSVAKKICRPHRRES